MSAELIWIPFPLALISFRWILISFRWALISFRFIWISFRPLGRPEHDLPSRNRHREEP
jgi:hypothetical protein